MSSRRPGFLVRLLARLVARLYLRRPQMADVIAIRYSSLRAFVIGIGNELAYRIGSPRSLGMLSVNLELTNHCNLKCSFCPTGNGLMTRPRGFMDPTVFRKALRDAGPLEFVLLFQWGESLLHPQFTDLAQEVGRRGSRALVTTNGTLLDDRRVQQVIDAGLDRVTVSIDGDAATHEAVRGVPLQRTRDGLDRLLAARDAERPEMAVDVSMVIAPETECAAASFRETFSGRVDRVQQIPLLTEGERRTRCREPWRSGPVVLQDGRVTVCCVDHDGDLAVGDVREQSLKEIWNGPGMQAIRKAHVSGDLPSICAKCTEYPTDAAAPRFSQRDEASKDAPHLKVRTPLRARKRVPEKTTS